MRHFGDSQLLDAMNRSSEAVGLRGFRDPEMPDVRMMIRDLQQSNNLRSGGWQVSDLTLMVSMIRRSSIPGVANLTTRKFSDPTSQHWTSQKVIQQSVSCDASKTLDSKILTSGSMAIQ
ncbi:unnamed protein product [Protopolystoma xenopodis]|uniref:Uncharacterized protein n=1 Tax=Protopolystoma xenopodis TaxID=117903 RepID=A0A448XBP7_9PLAT|nr:unnamed protein product [Protopolystoma xenopodis]